MQFIHNDETQAQLTLCRTILAYVLIVHWWNMRFVNDFKDQFKDNEMYFSSELCIRVRIEKELLLSKNV